MPRLPVLLALCAAIMLLTGCGGGPREPHVPHRVAANWYMPMTVKVTKVWDMVRHNVPSAAPHVTHLVEVLVVEPPRPQRGLPTVAKGDKVILPYDSYARAAKPPPAGMEMTISAADWVRNDPNAKGSPGKPWNSIR